MPDDLERIRRLLWEEWDPIGVNDMDDAWPEDEYDMYAPQVLKMAQLGVSAETIAAYLEEVEVKMIGIEASPTRNHSVALKALALLGTGDLKRQ
jgi:hypothetical protein